MTSLIPDPERPNTYLIGNAAEESLGIQVGSAVLTNVHSPNQCGAQYCVIHNPSDHHMRGWDLNWRGDVGVMERLCPHGVGHPDPDSLAFHASQGRDWVAVHGCDGCCLSPED